MTVLSWIKSSMNIGSVDVEDAGHFGGGERPGGARCQFPGQSEMSHLLPVQPGHPIAHGMEHPFHLVIATLVDGHPGFPLAQALQPSGRSVQLLILKPDILNGKKEETVLRHQLELTCRYLQMLQKKETEDTDYQMVIMLRRPLTFMC